MKENNNLIPRTISLGGVTINIGTGQSIKASISVKTPDENLIPKGWYKYSIEDVGDFKHSIIEIRKSISHNHMFDILTTSRVEELENSSKDIGLYVSSWDYNSEKWQKFDEIIWHKYYDC